MSGVLGVILVSLCERVYQAPDHEKEECSEAYPYECTYDFEDHLIKRFEFTGNISACMGNIHSCQCSLFV